MSSLDGRQQHAQLSLREADTCAASAQKVLLGHCEVSIENKKN